MNTNPTIAKGTRWRQPLAVALCASLVLHGVFYGTWRVGRSLGWWDNSMPFLGKLLNRLSSVMVDPKQIQEAIERQQRLAAEEIPLMFIDVSPEQAVTEKPENAKFYSALNAEAASTKPSEKDSDEPEIDGEQEKVLKTFDTPHNSPQPAVQPQPKPLQVAKTEPVQAVVDPDKLQPDPKPDGKPAGKPDVPEASVAEAKATTPGSPDKLNAPTLPTPKPGDLARATIAPQPEKGDGSVRRGEEGEASQPRPRTIAEARRQLPQDGGIAGQRMKLEGGSRVQRVMPSFNTEGTVWGSYDAKLIAIIQNQWFHFLDLHPEAFNWAGSVSVKFLLHSDGRVTDFEVMQNNSGELQAFGTQKAIIRDLGEPYDPWPPTMRRTTEKSFRELRITFYYN